MSNSVALLSVGDEIVLGQILDTNSTHIAAALRALGRLVSEMRSVGDDLTAIAGAIAELASRHATLVITGGLGPTKDDLTRRALAQAAGVPLMENRELVRQIEARFASFKRPMTALNRVQALLPEGADGIPNALGTAPGISMSLGTCRVFALPGVPREMRPMLEAHVLPALGSNPAGKVVVRELHLWGLGESAVAERLGDFMERGRTPTVGTRVSDTIVTIRLVDQGPDAREAQRRVDRLEAEILGRLGAFVFGVDESTLPAALLQRLKDNSKTLAVAESCTGGLLSKLLTDVPGSSEVFQEGFVTYANAAKTGRLGVDKDFIHKHGAVSEAVARAMAEGVRRLAGTDFGIGITGIAGPGGGSLEKPSGLVHIAVADLAGTMHQEYCFASDREGNRVRAAYAALGMTYHRLEGAS
ncbi:MAG: competence/damage-inducible protein A [Planctomycetota bacterium]